MTAPEKADAPRCPFPIDLMDPDTPQPLGMPLQYMLCSEALERIRRAGREELMGTPIGQLVGSFKETKTVAETIATLLADYEKSVSSLPRLSIKEPTS